jgi:hypothetical protein
MKERIVRPTPSFQLRVPEDVCEQVEGRVLSFWMNKNPLLLQISSYARESGPQISAQQRLSDRMSKHSETWRIWRKGLHPNPLLDQAIGEFIDHEGVLRIHAYFVWLHLTIYVTVSGPPERIRDESNWAVAAVKSIEIVLQ